MLQYGLYIIQLYVIHSSLLFGIITLFSLCGIMRFQIISDHVTNVTCASNGSQTTKWYLEMRNLRTILTTFE